MGTTTVSQKNKKAQSSIDPPKLQITLDVDIEKPVPSGLLQLTNCIWVFILGSFSEIMDALQVFYRLTESPMMDSFLFHKIMPFSKKNSDLIFLLLSKGASN